MADEPITATEAVVAEPEAPATPPEPPKPEPVQAPDPDYRAAYVGLQRTINKLHSRNEDWQRQNRELSQAVETIKAGQAAILRQTLGEDEARALESRQLASQQQTAQLEAAKAAEQYIVNQTGLFLEVLTEAGVDPKSIDWANDAVNATEWAQRVGPVVKAAVRSANESRIRQHTASLQAKSAQEVKAEAEALTQRQLKESGVDRIDTAKGAGPSTFAQRIRDMDTNSPEFAKMLSDAKAGRLST